MAASLFRCSSRATEETRQALSAQASIPNTSAGEGRSSPVRTSSVFGESHGDQLLDERLRKWLVDREVKGALRHRVTLELIGQLRQDRAAERQITQVVPKCGKACNGPTSHPEGRYTVGDDLFGLGHDLEDRAAKRLKRSALRLLEPAQVRIDVRGGHRVDSRPLRGHSRTLAHSVSWAKAGERRANE